MLYGIPLELEEYKGGGVFVIGQGHGNGKAYQWKPELLQQEPTDEWTMKKKLLYVFGLGNDVRTKTRSPSFCERCFWFLAQRTNESWGPECLMIFQ
jgi:hypothetical protein